MITLNGGVGNFITLNNKVFSYFGGNNYLGLANHPSVVKYAIMGLKKYGTNFSASRQTTGTSDLHLQLEKQLAGFKNQQDAVVFASGYLGNKLLLDALKDQYSEIMADSQAHPSILDGIPRDITHLSFYNHCNPDHLEDLLKKTSRRTLIITDGVFALTGQIAPIDQYYALAEKYNAMIVVDDAHATGVLGKNGRGTPEHFNLDGANNLYQSETMSKALGAYGGFIAATSLLTETIRSKSAFYGASTALPPPVVAAACAAIEIITQYPDIRKKLMENAALVRSGVREMGFSSIEGITPIIPVLFDDRHNAANLSAYLENNNIVAPLVNYPLEMKKSIVRITVSASHTTEQIENLVAILKKWRDNYTSITK